MYFNDIKLNEYPFKKSLHMKSLDDAYIRLLDHILGSEISLSPFQVSRLNNLPIISH